MANAERRKSPITTRKHWIIKEIAQMIQAMETNTRQIALIIVLILIIALAGCLYGLGGAVFLIVISAVIVLIFFRALSTESIKAELEYMADYEDYFGDNDPVYDPMLCSLSQNIYHQD